MSGGRFSFKDDASGTILRCEPARNFEVSWDFGGDTSWVECLVKNGTFSITHTSPVNEHWEKYGPSATGVGWEMAMVGLTAYLGGKTLPSVKDFSTTQHGRAFVKDCCQSWATAHIVAGADESRANAAATNTAVFYTAA